jgi:hypothetical protein
MENTTMLDVIVLAGALGAGYALAIYTWPAMRAFLVGIDQELVWLKARAAELEAKLRAALGRDER